MVAVSHVSSQFAHKMLANCQFFCTFWDVGLNIAATISYGSSFFGQYYVSLYYDFPSQLTHLYASHLI